MTFFSTLLSKSSSSGEPLGAVVPRLGGCRLVPRPSGVLGGDSWEVVVEELEELLVDSLSESSVGGIPRAALRAFCCSLLICFWLCLCSLALALLVKRRMPSRAFSITSSLEGWMTNFWLAWLIINCACSSTDSNCWKVWSVDEWPLWCAVSLSASSMGPSGCPGLISLCVSSSLTLASSTSQSSSISSRIVSRTVFLLVLVYSVSSLTCDVGEVESWGAGISDGSVCIGS